MKKTGKKRILVVDDEKMNIIAITHILGNEYTIFAAKNGEDAIEIANEHRPDLILLDIMMPGMNGYDVITILKEDEKTSSIPVIFITGLGTIENEEKGLSLGAADYIVKPLSPPIVRLRVRSQIQILNQMEIIRHLSSTDQLTGIANRRSFDDRLRLEWEHSKRNQKPLTIFIFDIDNFKAYNDKYGHLQGDAALQTVAKISTESLKRSIDFIARWGGEEFIVLLPETDIKGAMEVAEKIRENIESTPLVCSNGNTTKLTVSIGVNTLIPNQGCEVEDFFAEADKALYKAKKTGKNKVCVAPVD